MILTSEGGGWGNKQQSHSTPIPKKAMIRKSKRLRRPPRQTGTRGAGTYTFQAGSAKQRTGSCRATSNGVPLSPRAALLVPGGVLFINAQVARYVWCYRTARAFSLRRASPDVDLVGGTVVDVVSHDLRQEREPLLVGTAADLPTPMTCFAAAAASAAAVFVFPLAVLHVREIFGLIPAARGQGGNAK